METFLSMDGTASKQDIEIMISKKLKFILNEIIIGAKLHRQLKLIDNQDPGRYALSKISKVVSR